jgi:hypothetical protein
MLSASPMNRIRDLPALHRHIAFHGGLNEDDPANTPISFNSMVRRSMELGETREDAEKTADRVLLVASVMLPGAKGTILHIRNVTFTVQDAIGLMHPARHTGIYDQNGNVKQEVLQEVYQDKYAVEEKADGGAVKLISISKLMQFRQDRFNANKETNPQSGCCAALFAKKASNNEFGSFVRLYPVPTRTMKVNGKEEVCFTDKEIDEFYNDAYASGNKVIARVSEKAKHSVPSLVLGGTSYK